MTERITVVDVEEEHGWKKVTFSAPVWLESCREESDQWYAELPGEYRTNLDGHVYYYADTDPNADNIAAYKWGLSVIEKHYERLNRLSEKKEQTT